MLKRSILFLIILFLISLRIEAVPANPEPITLTQPSGKTFKARQQGDEWYNWVMTIDGYGIYQNKSTGNWEYYLPSGDKNGSTSDNISGFVVGEIDTDKFGIPKGLRPNRTIRKESFKTEKGSISRPGLENSVNGNTFATGDKSLLVICVDFADVNGTYDPLEIQPLFFGANYGVSDYYKKVSNSKVSIIPAFESSGVANDGIIGWLHLNENHPNTGSGWSAMNKQLAKDAIIAADPYIDYSIHDENGDSTVSSEELSIIIIVAGFERSYDNNTPAIWGHKWSMGEVGYPFVDGKKIEEYCQIGEKHTDHFATIGIMAHELGHLLFNLPDLYDTEPTGKGDSYGVGYFDLMANGSWASKAGEYHGSLPVQLSAWSKEYLSWGQIKTIDTEQDLKLIKTDNYSSYIFHVKTSDPNQYFLLENRQYSGYDLGFQRYGGLSGHGGVVIYHIDNLKTRLWPYSDDVNADVNNKGVDVEEANEGILGRSMLDLREKPLDTQMFFFSGNNSEFTNFTTPGSKLKNGVSTKITITDISASNDTMTAKISFNSPPVIKLEARISPDSRFLVNFALNAEDLDGKIVKYEWDFDGDGTFDSAKTADTAIVAENIDHTYNSCGAYFVKVKVTDDNGSANEKVLIVGIKIISNPIGNINTKSPGSYGRVDGHDLFLLAKAFGSKAGDLNWDINADFNDDFIVDGQDLVLLGVNFGK